MRGVGLVVKRYIPFFSKIEEKNAFWARAVAKWAARHNFVANENVIRDAKDRINKSIREGRKVLLIAHSQGNLYMNNIYKSLDEDDKYYVKLLSVATPASFVGEEGVISPYVSRNDDVVVLYTNPSSLPPSNVQPTLFDEGFFALNHDFIARYLNDPPIFALIKNYVLDQIQAHITPYVLGKYDIQHGSFFAQAMGTLKYSAGQYPSKNDVDVDLHIFEPGNNKHVYYASRFGIVGYIGRDANGFSFTENRDDYYKTETYRVCPKYAGNNDKVPPSGIYYVALNYFACPLDYYEPVSHNPDSVIKGKNDWDYEAVVYLNIYAGPKKLEFQYNLPSPRGPGGDGNPIIVASIEVKKKDGKPRYTLKRLL